MTGEEATALLAPLHGVDTVALAVSGGPDSTALMLLAARWRAQSGAGGRPHIVVLSVDHGLRAEAGEECRLVGEWARALGLAHETLRWTGPKPASGVQEAAREARYALMTQWCRAHGVGRLATAHALEDQAETVLMRLARGSGVDGLAGMAAHSRRDGVTILRPLLDVPRARLRATLAAAGHPWLEDPSNADPRFERVRLRAALPDLAALGLTSEALARSARRARRAGAALDAIAQKSLSQAARLWDGGFCTLDRAALATAEREIALRVLQAVVSGVANLPHPPGDEPLERLLDWASGAAGGARTLAGCRIAPRGGRLVVARELGRMAAAPVVPEPGRDMVWDGRFVIRLDAPGRVPNDVAVAPLGRHGWARLRKAGRPPRLPAFAAHSLPALWRGDRLASVPHLAYVDEDVAGSLVLEAEPVANGAIRHLPRRRLAAAGHDDV